ncbi:MAG: 2-C-methyl-D-erythritol 4-phosphate cytidylyltransferase [Bacteroides sp.]|jgi:2-C-methyl-D-erythritol 4-phosphate cytidylyltransferase|nr:2-C-methyl-D-erythritol 4-phosphate cytidylyltransferase [Bacteroides sp.]MCI1681614.1 2-C-methyl-D-erythritol 4-phosphate cytidylyltransferase [Bacteroides sp.]
MVQYVLILAGGRGVRMGGEVPKQFLLVKGKPLLMHTIEAFYSYNPHIKVILVLPSSQQNYWADLCKVHHFSLVHTVVDGGETRFHSVKNGLAYVTTSGLVGVHDGVRPFVSQQVIASCYTLAAQKKAVIPVVNVIETVRHLLPDGTSETVDREEYKLVQTPQVFEADLLKRAYEQPFVPSFTDDASVVEALGFPVYLTEGNRENIKITTPFDLRMAEAIIK